MVLTVVLLAYVALTSAFSGEHGIPKVNNPLGPTQWELDHIGNPEVQQHIAIIKSRQAR